MNKGIESGINAMLVLLFIIILITGLILFNIGIYLLFWWIFTDEISSIIAFFTTIFSVIFCIGYIAGEGE